MIYCEELNKSFESKELLFADLKANKSDILDMKKAQIQKSCEKGVSVQLKPLAALKLEETAKASFQMEEAYHYVAVNSTKILDSHNDLHLDGLWNKTVKEQQGKNFLVIDHKLEVDKVVVKKQHIEIFTAKVPFSFLGKSYPGETEILVYKFPKDKVINQTAKEWLESGDEIEASVRMQYVNIDLAMNSTDKADIEEKKRYDEYYDLIANKEDFEDEIMYFFPVTEAKNVRESSLVVFGSNSTTGTVRQKNTEADSITSDKQEPEQSTQKHEEQIKELLKKFN